MVRFLYKIILFLLPFSIISQSLTYRNYNVNQGLPSSQTYDIIQDQKKYIWVATDRGVSRFDGYNFTNYTSENGLLDNNIFNLYEDMFGRIWFLSYCGKLSYYFNGKIYPYKYNSKIISDPKKMAAAIRSFLVLPDSSVIIGTIGDGALKILNNGIVQNITYANPRYKYHYVFQYSDDRYYVYSKTNKGIVGEAISIMFKGAMVFNKEVPKGQMKNAFCYKRKNGHAIFTTAGYILDVYKGKVTDSIKEASDILSLYEDSDSCLWVGYLDGGVKRYSANKPITSKDYKLYFLQNQVTKILEDYEHGFWFSTLTSGVIYVPNIDVGNLEYTGEIHDKEKTVTMTSDHNSRIFIGTNKGTIKIYKGTSRIKEINIQNFARTLYFDSLKNILYISGHKTMYTYDDVTLKALKNGGILCFYKDTNDSIIAGSYNGIVKYFPDKIGPNIIAPNEIVRIETMCYDKNKRLWIGSYRGLYYLKNDTIIKQQGDTLFNYRITSLLSKGNSLFIGTIEKGLLKLTGNRIETFSLNHGLPSNAINWIEDQNDSIIWLATAKGACKFNINQNRSSFILNTKKGLLSNEVKNIQLVNDTIYFLTNEGITFCRSNFELKNQTPPAIFIQDFKVDTVSYIFQDNPTLNHSRNYLTFNVSGLTFKQAGNIKYTYRLKGYSEQWKTTSSNNIQLAFVPPGTYTFEVLAENEDGILSEHPDTFQFTISEPLWNRLWFQLLIALSLVTILVFVLLIRIKRIKEKNKILEQLTGFKQQALTMQMNPHFIFNLLSSIQSYVLSEDSVKASKYIAMFAKLMRKSLDNSRTEFIAFDQEIDTLKLYMELESIRLKNKIIFSFAYDGVLMHNIMIPPMLIQPHIENALKHAFINFTGDKEREIRVSFAINNKLLSCSVEDNGIGLNKSGELKQDNKDHMSAGLDVTKTRLELLCKNLGFPFSFSIQDLQDIDKDNNGTIVKFIVPYIYATESPDS